MTQASEAVEDRSWTPPEDAADNEVPAINAPKEAWEPAEGARFGAEAAGREMFRAPSGTVAGAPGLGEQPWFTFEDFELWEYSTAHVNVANGNLLVKANDSKIAVPGYGLRQDRYYNGLSTRNGSFGSGWQSNNGTFDVGVRDYGSYAEYYAFNGAEFRFDSDGNGGYDSPDGSNLSFEKDSSSGDFRYIVTVNKTGEQLMFAVQGWLSATLDRNGVGSYYSYNAGNIASVYHSNGRGYTFSWDSDFLLDEVTDSAGREIDYIYEDNSPRLVEVEDDENTNTFYEYDSTGRLDKIIYPGTDDDLEMDIEYDSSHRVTKITQAGVETSFTYNSGETVVTDANGNTATYTYDSEGRVTETEDGLGRTRSQTWTANSDIATTTDGIGTNTTTYTYDGNGNQTNAELPTGAAASAAYAIGTDCGAPDTGTAFQPKCSTDPAGNSKQYEYDTNGNLTKQTDTTDSTSTVEFERTYEESDRSVCGGYEGQICSTTDGRGKVTDYAYDTKGNLTSVTPPSPLDATTYTYDSMGRVTSVTDGNGDTTDYEYDRRDRTVEILYDNGADEIIGYYDNGLEKERWFDGPIDGIDYEYDDLGRITLQKYPDYQHEYTYDDVGNMLTFTDSAGTVTYTYDDANQLTSIQEPGGTCPATGNPAANSGCVLLEYDDNGNETKRIYPAGAHTDTTRDAAGRPTRITAKAADGSTAVDIGYSFTLPGTSTDQTNIQTRTSHKEEGITAGAVTTYSYDSRNRLTEAEEKDGSTVTAAWTYGYDNAGNRTTQTRTGDTGQPGGTIDHTYNDANQITSATGDTTTWTYDAAGNQTRNGQTGKTITYNDLRQASTIDGTTQEYFGGGNTDRQASGTVNFENGALGTMQSSGSAATNEYTRSPDGAAISFGATTRHYYVADHLGSHVGLFDETGNTIGGYSYSPYGEERHTGASTQLESNTLRYIGQHQDPTGLYKFGERYYDPTIGRFTQMDPSGQEANPFLYAEGNPTNWSDPTGLAIDWQEVGYQTTAVAFGLVFSGLLGVAAAPLCVTVVACIGVELLAAVGGGMLGDASASILWGREYSAGSMWGL